jgi:hypothetical protein
MEESNNLEFSKKLALYFDHQMNPEDEKEFLLQTQRTPDSQSAFIKELNIRQKLRANIHRPSHSNSLAKQIKDQIKKYPG